ncbi:MAG: MoaD/ThiS family protein [Candidatus Thorarchaeota archaeon]|nr:MoaD/ThiS family protein [Candidatus Thorarchaeota archaeon]
MRVKIRFFAHFRDLIGGSGIVELDLEEGATISLLLEELFMNPRIKDGLCDTDKGLSAGVTILKNGREVKFLEGMETPLNSGDEIAIFPPIAGG